MLSPALAFVLAAAASGGRASLPPERFLARSFVAGELTLPYRLLVPRGYDPRRAYPLVVFLHGAGARGTDNLQPLAQGVLPWAHEMQRQHPAFLVVPQC